MNSKKRWEKFLKTGAVEDYVSYKSQLTKETRQREEHNAYFNTGDYPVQTEYRGERQDSDDFIG